jgi:hypothetical protein
LLVLVDMNGAEAARLTFLAEAGAELDSEDPSLRTVRSLRGSLPSFSFPEDLAEGYYSLEARLYDSSGRVLSNASTLVLVYNGVIPSPRIETYPSSPAKGQPVFMRLVYDLPDGLDPWLRWYVGESMRKEGYASEFADRLVWQVPELDGFFGVRTELFPFKPSVEVLKRSVPILDSRLSAFRADLILAVGPAPTPSPAIVFDQAYLVDFKSDPASQRMATSDGVFLPLLMIGTPYIESHEYGYGHALLEGSGYQIPGTILPRAGSPFTLSVALNPADSVDASGSMVSLYKDEDNSPFLRLGLSDGLPYIEAGDRRMQAFAVLPAGLSHLVLEVIPSEEDTAEAKVSFFLNNKLVGKGVIPSSLFAPAGSVRTLIGGPDGLAAVYDKLAVMIGRHQGFLIAKTQEFGSRLVAASGFEGGALGKGISVQGSADAEDGFIRLSPDASLEIPVPSAGFTLELEGHGEPLGLILVMDDGTLLPLSMSNPILGQLSLLNSGKVAEPPSMHNVTASPVEFPLPSRRQTAIKQSMNQSISLSVETVGGGLRIRDDTGRNDRIPTTSSAVALRVQPAMPVPTIIQTIMVRTFNPADSFEPAANTPLVSLSETAN